MIAAIRNGLHCEAITTLFELGYDINVAGIFGWTAVSILCTKAKTIRVHLKGHTFLQKVVCTAKLWFEQNPFKAPTRYEYLNSAEWIYTYESRLYR